MVGWQLAVVGWGMGVPPLHAITTSHGIRGSADPFWMILGHLGLEGGSHSEMLPGLKWAKTA